MVSRNETHHQASSLTQIFYFLDWFIVFRNYSLYFQKPHNVKLHISCFLNSLHDSVSNSCILQSDREKSRIFDNKDTYLSTNNKKMKRVAVEKDFDLDLIVSINCADGIDEKASSKSAVTSRFYRVLFWVHPQEQYCTHEVFGDPNPVWRQRCRIMLDRFKDYRFLHVEVIRYEYDPANDPGTSRGDVLVGRAQIPLPTLKERTKEGRYGLVRLDGDRYKAEGHLVLSMKLVKCVYD